MPRSLHSCYIEIVQALSGLSQSYGRESECQVLASAMLARLRMLDMPGIFQSGLHDFLTDFINDNSRLAREIAAAYHFNG